MKEFLLSEQTLTAEDGTPVVLSYYLLSEELNDRSGTPICELYGARIVRRRAEQVTQRSIPRITVLQREILRIVDALSQGTVTPETMEDCITELLP